MDVIPAIDLKNGLCVRLRQGRDDDTTSYSADPVAVAERWVSQGASRLHVVNLDGAFGRSSRNLDIIKAICSRVEAVVQCGGGIRSAEDAEAVLNAGCSKIVIGTSAVENLPFLRLLIKKYGPGRLIVALDTRDGKVATRGWTTLTEHDVLDVAKRMHDEGVAEILHTNILHDGMMIGADVETLQSLNAVGVSIIASGGISSVDDIRHLVSMKLANLRSVIVGKALYEGAIDLPKLLREIPHAEA